MTFSLDLERHLVFYGTYHQNPINMALHMLCVLPILFSAFALAINSGTLIWLPSWATLPYLELNLGTMAATLWGILYILLEPVAGTLLAILGLWVTATCNAQHHIDPVGTNKVALAVHGVCWVVQIIGRLGFERRGPSLVENIIESVFLAPLFIWLRFLFLLGYRRPLQGRVDEAIRKEAAKLGASEKKQ